MVAFSLFAVSMEGRITRLVVTKTEPLGRDGYQKVSGYAYGELDPKLPLNAVIKGKSNASGYAVSVVTEEGGRSVARVRDVKLGESFGNAVAVAEGLKPGDQVIVTGGTMVNDGDQVKVIP